jgi:hypothetical protein
MTRRLSIVAAICALAVALAVPGSASASSKVTSLAAAQCKNERKALGKKGFAKRYGKKGTGACIKKQKRAVRAAIADATDQCQSELDEFGPDEFFYEWESFEECVDWYTDEELNPSGDDGDDPIDDDEPDDDA